MVEKQFVPKKYDCVLEKGSVSCQSPSNIALVKYWGKYGEQLPKNASISFTLSNCNTKTKLSFKKIKSTENFNFEVFLDGKREVSFESKIQKFFERVEVYLPFLKKYKFKIETSNSFPHSSGIASSASGMSALAVCLVEIERSMNASAPLGNRDLKPSANRSLSGAEMHTSTAPACQGTTGRLGDHSLSGVEMQKASFLARLGSGSACRSLEGPLVSWGEHPEINGSSNLLGTKYVGEIHKNFHNYQDTILLVDKGEKQVSSTVGHDLMHNHPFAEKRFLQANENLSKLIAVFKSGNISEFIKIVESEALSLHAMMMTSMPYFILMKPETLQIINSIWKFRKETGSNICFTLDAGANVHVLYPENEIEKVQKFIEIKLSQFCKNGEFIYDFVGLGAMII